MAKHPAPEVAPEAAPEAAPRAVRAPVIVCIIPFNAWGHVYNSGDTVDPSDWEGVNAHDAETAIQNRMTNGFVKFARPE